MLVPKNNRNYVTLSAVHEALAKVYGKKILNRLKNDSSYGMLKDEINQHPGNSVEEKVISHIISKAPHDKYKKWLTATYANGGIQKLDDTDKAGHALTLFHKHVSKLPNKDIQTYRNLHDLESAVEPYEEKAKTANPKLNTAHYIKTGQATLVHDSPTAQVVIPQTEEASKYFGKNTKWCTSAENSRNYFKEYKPEGNLFYFRDKTKADRDDNKHAIFIPHKQFSDGEYRAPEGFDDKDKPMHPKKIMEIYDVARKDVENHVPGVAHKATIGTYEDENHPDYHKSADEIEKLVAKHVK